MAKKDFSLQTEQKVELGTLIKKLRLEKGLSLRILANAVGLSPSNMTYIEKGINAPTGEIYLKIISKLKPDDNVCRKMEILYMQIRNLPPPDVCEILMNNPKLLEKIRKNKNI